MRRRPRAEGRGRGGGGFGGAGAGASQRVPPEQRGAPPASPAGDRAVPRVPPGADSSAAAETDGGPSGNPSAVGGDAEVEEVGDRSDCATDASSSAGGALWTCRRTRRRAATSRAAVRTARAGSAGVSVGACQRVGSGGARSSPPRRAAATRRQRRRGAHGASPGRRRRARGRRRRVAGEARRLELRVRLIERAKRWSFARRARPAVPQPRPPRCAPPRAVDAHGAAGQRPLGAAARAGRGRRGGVPLDSEHVFGGRRRRRPVMGAW